MQVALKNKEFQKMIPTNEQFNNYDAWGLYSSVDIYHCDHDIITNKEMIKQYVIQLCDLLGMKRFNETQVVHFGKEKDVEGYSMVQLIETSLISGHFVNHTNTSYIDVFSCKYYEPEVIAHFSLSYFKGSNYSINVLLRK